MNSEAQANLCRQDPNVINTRKVPIIFVPGVMGSRLHFTDIDECWNPDSAWDMLHWVFTSTEKRRKELHWTAPAKVMSENEALASDERGRGWEGVSADSYLLFLQEAKNWFLAKMPVYAIGYDWRQSHFKSADYLTEEVFKILKNEKVDKCILVTHSMGGLVTRTALKNDTDSLADRVLGVIHLFQPTHGAVTLYRRFFTGAQHGIDGEGLQGAGLTSILGNTPERFATVLSGLPGPMELLPTTAYHDGWPKKPKAWLKFAESGKHKPWEGDIFELYQNPSSPPGLVEHSDYESRSDLIQIKNQLMNRLKVAKTFHSWLGDFKHEKTWAVYGTGLETDMATLFDPPKPPNPRYLKIREPKYYDGGVQYVDLWPYRGAKHQRREEGDGTVPAPSGAGLFLESGNAPKSGEDSSAFFHYDLVQNDKIKQYEITGVAHDQACNDSKIRNLVDHIIFNLISDIEFHEKYGR